MRVLRKGISSIEMKPKKRENTYPGRGGKREREREVGNEIKNL
jgi:hypothetical protein